MPCRLYLITPPTIEDASAFLPRLDAALAGGDVAAVQIRLKPASDAHILEVGRALVPHIQAGGVAVLLNDRPDLAAQLGCDGVHLGQSDASLAEARRQLGRDAMIGVTCHDSRHLAMEAAEAGADYVAFGAFFPTTTKDTVHRPDPEILTIWQETMQTPCVAIGGINADNAELLASAGADFIAVSSAVWDAADPGDAVARLNAALARAAG
ncbi:thiamine phosphate synthase [Brevundimonas sp. 2R-24]|uniref:Thiamine-phosphate synthase n=1 Tax=Peiella sedimenti TaxID=3061083 RepID=A0ABT8SHI3_9CAUL|nr:thiamine phosphate synthase [Caulobacteraceae bacterium XZ-24]